MSNHPQLFLWFDRDPAVFEPDHKIDDVPGTADIDLLTDAILEGQFGNTLPSRIHMSTQRSPENPKAVRTIDVGRLLRDIGVQHRRCYQIELPQKAE
jgi:hypothetical protein